MKFWVTKRPLLVLLIFTQSVHCRSLNKETLSEWRSTIIECAKKESLAPNLVVRNLAILSLGCFEILNAKERKYHSFFDHNLSLPLNFDSSSSIRGYCLEIALFLHPHKKSSFFRLAHRQSLDSQQIGHTPSFIFGKELAHQILAIRADDGATTKITFIPNTTAGKWRRTPSAHRPPEQPHWSKVKPFKIDVEEFLPPPPPPLDSQLYYDAVKEAKIWGNKNSLLRTKDQTIAAEFWKDFSYSSTPPGRWNHIAQNLSTQFNLSVEEDARLFALLNITLTDAGIAAWATKFKYRLWRPIHAIRLADQINSTSGLSDPYWSPLLETPPHPEYISGHGCYSGAAAEVLTHILGTNKVSFQVTHEENSSITRSYRSLDECSQEIGNSRLWGGIHFPFSNKTGLLTGKKIAQFICSNLFLKEDY
jgi:hypothetical protein